MTELRKKLMNQMDTLWSKAIKALWDGRCGRCGSRHNVAAHHLIGRGHKWRRWLLQNGILLCEKHHNRARDNADEFEACFAASYPKRYQWWLDNRVRIPTGPVPTEQLLAWKEKIRIHLQAAGPMVLEE